MTKKNNLALDYLQEVFSKIPRHLVFAFISACVVFVIVHAGYFDDRMVNEDFHHFIQASAQRIQYGRFFCFNFLTDYCNSWMLGCEACLYFALATVFLVDLLKVRTKIGVGVVAALVVSMPSLSYLFDYLFSAPLLGRIAFLTALSVWAVERWRWGFVPAIIVFAVTLGVGQNALIVAAVLCSLVILRDLMLEDEDFSYKKTIIKAVKLLVMGVVGVALYFLIWKVILKITGTSVASYKGMDQIGSFTLTHIFKAVKNSFKDFKDFFFGSRFFYVSTLQKIVYLMFFLTSGFSIIFTCVKYPVRIPGILLVLLLLPLCVGSIQIFVPQVKTDTLMVYPIIYIMAFGVTISESILPRNWSGSIASWLLLVALIVTSLGNYSITSAYYVKAETYNEHTYTYVNRLLSRIESAPGYYSGIPVAVISDDYTSVYHGMEEQDFPGILNDRGMRYSFVGTRNSVAKKTYVLIEAYTGVSLTKASSKATQEIRNTAEYAEMPAFPAEGSIRIINGVLTVNCMSEEVVVKQINDNMIMLNYLNHDTAETKGKYAWNAYKNNEIVDELGMPFQTDPEHLVTLVEDGSYTFKGFYRVGKETHSIKTFTIEVKDGVIVEDTRMKKITLEDEKNEADAEEPVETIALPNLEINVTMMGDRAVRLMVTSNSSEKESKYTYAWRVFRNGERLEEYDRTYTADPEYNLILSEDGEYRFKLFYRIGEATPLTKSKTVIIDGTQINEDAA